ncbi:ACDE family multidrug resistance protein [Desulfitispora alkaliphila]|uniref:MFS transporter n=1 Tax=Desulfitispora alkaliphila TaxID=622674 RepID=UPI003D19F1D8
MQKGSLIKLAALCGVPFIMVLGNSMLIPVFPQMQSDLGITQLQVGLTITLFSIPAGLTIPILGFVSDKIGRKKVIVPALILYAIGGTVSGLAPLLMENPYNVLLAGRVIQGIGAGGTGPIAMALVGDIFKGSERSQALGIIEAANGIGKVISPIVGALIGLIIWYALFYVYALLAIPIAIGVWLAIKEPPLETKDRTFKKYVGNITTIFKQKGKTLLGCYAAGSVVLLVLFGVLSFLSDALENEYGLTGVVKGFALAGPVLAMSATAFLSGRYLQNHMKKMKESIVLGLAMSVIALAMITVIKNDIVFFAGLFFNGVGAGLVLPAVNTLITSSAPLEERGGITALYGSVRFFGVAAGPPAFSSMLEVSRMFMFGSGAAMVALSLALAAFTVNEKEIFDNQAKGEEGDKVGDKQDKQDAQDTQDNDREEENKVNWALAGTVSIIKRFIPKLRKREENKEE